MKTNLLAQDIREPGRTGSALPRGSRAQRPGQIYRRILLALDFSPASERLFEQAAKLARENRAELLIAHADIVPSSLSFVPSTSYDVCYEESRAESKKQIEWFVEKARKQGLYCHALEMSGFADEAVVYAAKKLDVDLIVVGNHGRKGISRFLRESVAARLIAHAPCSVLAVHLDR